MWDLALLRKIQTILSMSKFTSLFLASFIALAMFGCAALDEGQYSGRIGKKREVTLRILPDSTVELEGYWQEPLQGTQETGNLKDKTYDALVFLGPEDKKFKLRFIYEKDGEDLVILAIHSRTFGPGARYAPTEPDSLFTNPPRLTRLF